VANKPQAWWPDPVGPARVVVPIVAGDMETAEAQARAIAATDADMVEWRADAFAAVGPLPGEIARFAGTLRQIVAPKPLIATWRTGAEGGAAPSAGGDGRCHSYEEMTAAWIDARSCDAIDVQVFDSAGPTLIAQARRNDMPVIGSWHDLAGTPPVAEIVDKLAAIEAAGASVAKVAVTARRRADVTALLDATRRRAAVAGIPLITMAMGDAGIPTRVLGYQWGSQATWATVGPASAPGQVRLHMLRQVWAQLTSDAT